MSRVFPTRDKLMTMPLNLVRGQDIRTLEEETLVQEVVNLRLVTAPLDLTIDRHDVPDIRTKEQEEKWQKIIDERTAKARGLQVPKQVVEEEITFVSDPIEQVSEEDLLKISDPGIVSLVPKLKSEPEPVIKKPIGRPKNCEICKQSKHLKDCPKNQIYGSDIGSPKG